jgi:hypothetical protein
MDITTPEETLAYVNGPGREEGEVEEFTQYGIAYVTEGDACRVDLFHDKEVRDRLLAEQYRPTYLAAFPVQTTAHRATVLAEWKHIPALRECDLCGESREDITHYPMRGGFLQACGAHQLRGTAER